MIHYTCPHCGKNLNIPEQYAGQAGACSTCKNRIVVPPLAGEVVDAPRIPGTSGRRVTLVLAGGLGCLILALGGWFLSSRGDREDSPALTTPEAVGEPMSEQRVLEILENGGDFWSSNGETTMGGQVFLPGERFWIWPESDTKVLIRNEKAVIRLRWQLRPGQKLPGPEEELRAMDMFLIDTGGSTDYSITPRISIELEANATQGVIQFEQNVGGGVMYDEMQGEATLIIILTTSAISLSDIYYHEPIQCDTNVLTQILSVDEAP